MIKAANRILANLIEANVVEPIQPVIVGKKNPEISGSRKIGGLEGYSFIEVDKVKDEKKLAMDLSKICEREGTIFSKSAIKEVCDEIAPGVSDSSYESILKACRYVYGTPEIQIFMSTISLNEEYIEGKLKKGKLIYAVNNYDEEKQGFMIYNIKNQNGKIRAFIDIVCTGAHTRGLGKGFLAIMQRIILLEAKMRRSREAIIELESIPIINTMAFYLKRGFHFQKEGEQKFWDDTNMLSGNLLQPKNLLKL